LVIGFFRLVVADTDELAMGAIIKNGVDGSVAVGVNAEDTRVNTVDTRVVAIDTRLIAVTGRYDANNMCGK
jgi:hypothetical protein